LLVELLLVGLLTPSESFLHLVDQQAESLVLFGIEMLISGFTYAAPLPEFPRSELNLGDEPEADLVLIDQPEDDLDSQTVYEEVVKRIRDIKSGRQFIFATHNANFPVLGDSELVLAFSSSDDKIAVSSASIDVADCQTRIIRIMEGGPEAFARRKTIYEHWKTGL